VISRHHAAQHKRRDIGTVALPDEIFVGQAIGDETLAPNLGQILGGQPRMLLSLPARMSPGLAIRTSNLSNDKTYGDAPCSILVPSTEGKRIDGNQRHKARSSQKHHGYF
jgi:hypothetical protein